MALRRVGTLRSPMHTGGFSTTRQVRRTALSLPESFPHTKLRSRRGADGTQSLYYFGQQGTHAHQGASSRGQFGAATAATRARAHTRRERGREPLRCLNDSCCWRTLGIGQLSIIRDRWISLGADIPLASANSNGSTQPLCVLHSAKSLCLCHSNCSHSIQRLTRRSRYMRTAALSLPQCPGSTAAINAGHALLMTLNADVSVGGNLSLAILDGDRSATHTHTHADSRTLTHTHSLARRVSRQQARAARLRAR